MSQTELDYFTDELDREDERKKNEITFVQQRNDRDCTIAAIAMAANVSYEKVIKVLDELDYAIPPDYKQEDEILKCLSCLPLRSVYPEALEPHSIYILAVPSLNFKGGMHSIVVKTNEKENGRIWIEVYDPQAERENVESYTHETLNAWAHPCKIVRL